jgi:hypothetical protein
MYITNTVTNQVKYSFEFTFIIRHVIYSLIHLRFQAILALLKCSFSLIHYFNRG